MSGQLSILLIFLASATAGAAVEIDRVERSTVYFKDSAGSPPSPITLQAHDLSPIGSLQAPESLPYFLIAASPCKECVQDRSIHVIRPGNKQFHMSFVYPGRIVDTKSGLVFVDSRAFYGKCLKGQSDVYVAFQKERIPRKRGSASTQLSVFVAEAGADRIYEKLHDKALPRIDHTLRMVKAKSCFEIPRRNRTTKSLASFKPGSRPLVKAEEEDDDDEEKKSPDAESEDAPKSDPGN